MQRTWTSRSAAALAAIGLLALAAPNYAAPRPDLPTFDPANFSGALIDNPYFPLKPGTSYDYRSQTAAGVETSTFEITFETKSILTVPVTVVHDVVKLDGGLIEDTFDWFAQDKDGNVWYLGEDTKEYDGHGNFLTSEGSWTAGEGGAVGGIVMLAHPAKGIAYAEEFSAGVAEDQGRIASLGGFVTVPAGSYSNVLEILEWTPLEPGSRERKLYAPNVGLVLTEGKKERVELIHTTGL